MTDRDREPALLEAAIDRKQAVSFDVFDTLLLREVHRPKDIFYLLEPCAESRFGVRDFYKKRVEAERRARTFAPGGECNFDEIYAALAQEIGPCAADLQERERRLEACFSVANPVMKRAFGYARERGKTVLIISDMYLPAAVIRTLLQNAGYPDCPLYVSNEYRCNKQSGALFQYVQKELDLTAKTWLHVGDNPVGDCEAPRALGIDAYLYVNVADRANAEPQTAEERIAQGLLNNALYCGAGSADAAAIDSRLNELLKKVSETL